MINPIANGESGSSVRNKLNQTIAAVQEMAIRASDLGRTSSTMTDDPVLFLDVPSGEMVEVSYQFIFSEDTSSGVQMNWSFSIATTTGPVWVLKDIRNGANPATQYSTGTLSDYIPSPAATTRIIEGSLSFTAGAGTGGLALRWANATGAGTLTLKAGSWMRVRRSS